MKSVKPQLNKMQIFKTNQNRSHGSGGKSGSFFFFTEDRKFIIKTMTKQEKKNLMKILPQMTKFIMETGGKSLISRVYGVYKVQYPGMASIFLMLQRNNIRLQQLNELVCSFDLKGSKYDREVVTPEMLKYEKGIDDNWKNIMLSKGINKNNISTKLNFNSIVGRGDAPSFRRNLSHHSYGGSLRIAAQKLRIGSYSQNSTHSRSNDAESDIPKCYSKSTLKDLDFESMIKKNLLSLDIPE